MILGTGAALVASAPAAQAQSYRFTSIKVEGNQHIESGTIVSILHLQRGKALSAADLNDAYQRLAQKHLFESIVLTPRGNTLVVKVTEYPTIDKIAFEGNERYKDKELSKLIKSTAHRVYSPAQAEADAATIAKFYYARGRYAAIVTPKIIKRPDNAVDLVFEIREGKTTEVQRISIIGNQHFTNRRLRQVLATKQAGLLHQFIQSDTYLHERIAEDRQKLTEFYQRRGFIDFEILDVASEFERNRSGFFLTFTVHEGLPYTFGKITMASDVPGLSAKPYEKALRIRAGSTYSPLVMKDNIRRIENILAEQGVTFVTVDPVITRDRANQKLNIVFTLKKSPRVFVQRIDIQGNTTTLDRVIRRQFHTAEGDPFNPRKIQAAADRLRKLGYFSDVEVSTKPGSGPDEVIVDVNVKEKPTGSLTFGLSYGVSSGVGAVVNFAESNFLGRGQAVNFQINTGVNNASSVVSFVEPYLLGRDVQFGFNAFYSRQNYYNTYFDSSSYGVQPSLTFPVSNNGKLTLNYRFASDSMSNVDSGAAVPSAVLQSEVGSRTTSSLGYEYSFDSRRTGLDPNDGIMMSFGQDFAGAGGANRYIKTSAKLAGQTRIFDDEVTLRATLKGGLLSMLSGQSSRAVDRYNNNGEIRGFRPWGIGPRDLNATNQDALGGNKFAVLRLEADFPLGLPAEYGISGGVFWDMGSVWGLNSSELALMTASSQDTAKFHLRSAIGLSIFWKTPIGPLRFNFSHAIKKESYDRVQNFDLTISSQF
ncbi:outer membrane protein assembly factor BamA [Allgaiera indica]|uniref:Outer membrane protein assembly factor BamA n=1 Tax=Allgaiera indica TaxID=765699 RepID=A0AAN4UQU3_9RHOB|nr:outer membrane protein assembly factor BamA [Allgaiera indica]